MTLNEVIADAKRSQAELRKFAPWMFPNYLNWEAAKKVLAEAQKEELRWRKLWEKECSK